MKTGGWLTLYVLQSYVRAYLPHTGWTPAKTNQAKDSLAWFFYAG
jgi:hypothetical protein